MKGVKIPHQNMLNWKDTQSNVIKPGDLPPTPSKFLKLSAKTINLVKIPTKNPFLLTRNSIKCPNYNSKHIQLQKLLSKTVKKTEINNKSQ